MSKDNTNNNKQITDVVPQNELDTQKDRDLQFIEAYLDCLDVREAGRRLGYAETTINSGYLYQKFKKHEFQEKLKHAYIARDYQDLALIYSLERLGLQEIAQEAKDKPNSIVRNLANLKHITKQKKQISGILQDTPKPQEPTFNLTEIRCFVQQFMPDRPKSIDGEVFDKE